MMKFDHVAVPVSDYIRSRDWYMATLGLKVEFELPERRTVALQDSEGFAIFLQETPPPIHPNGCAMWFQVGDVDATFSEWSARGIDLCPWPSQDRIGVRCRTGRPRWIFVRLWDERTMKEK